MSGSGSRFAFWRHNVSGVTTSFRNLEYDVEYGPRRYDGIVMNKFEFAACGVRIKFDLHDETRSSVN